MKKIHNIDGGPARAASSVDSQRESTHLTDTILNRAAPAPGLLGGGLGASTECLDCKPVIAFRGYQQPVFLDRTTGLVLLHWSRQIGKSYTLASWAVDRLLSQLQTHNSWLVTVLSNSRDNGAEFVLKAAEVCKQLGLAQRAVAQGGSARAASGVASQREATHREIGDAAVFVEDDQSADLKYENMRMEVRITMVVDGQERVGRIKVLAANPRTARGFSGDLILDEFAFHEDSPAIWDAAEPILSANPQFLCRIASTGNGKHNMFYRMVSSGEYKVVRVSRTDAWKQGVKIYDPNNRQTITPEEARRKSMDKRSYDQNYELAFNDENMCLLTNDLVSAAERVRIPIDEQTWSAASIARMFRAEGDLFIGNDIGRNRDLSVVAVMERFGKTKRMIGMLRMSGMRGPDQCKQLEAVCRLPKFRGYCGDMTGLGTFFVEFLQDALSDTYRVRGINFASTEPINDRLRAEGRKAETARVTELMAGELLGAFEDKSIEITFDSDLRADLLKPEKITSPGGRVSIAATRDEAGHADHFWALALALRAMTSGPSGPFAYQSTRAERPGFFARGRGMPV